MKQVPFADDECAGERKQVRRERFLIEMDRVVPWKGLIEPHYPKGYGGCPVYPLMAMTLWVHLMQSWFGYSDPAMEEALNEATILRQFFRAAFGSGGGKYFSSAMETGHQRPLRARLALVCVEGLFGALHDFGRSK